MGSDKLKILPYLFLLMLMAACHTSAPVNKDLRLADSIMEEHPDTAMYVLKKITDPQFMSEAEYAMYCLLTTQANDLTGTPHTSDELITVAARYFKTGNDLSLRAKAYYYLGKVKEDLNEYASAEEAYLLAISTMEKTRNHKQTGNYCKTLANFYLSWGMHTQSADMQQNAYNNYLLAAKEENRPHYTLILFPPIILVILIVLLVRYQVRINREKQALKRQEKQLLNAQRTIDVQKTELNHLRKELKTMKKSVYNSVDIVQKVQKFNALPISSKEKPSLTEYEWALYMQTLDDTFSFVTSLKNMYHKLTDIDIRICALLREGISNQHIATLMGMTTETLNRRIQRIRNEKMNQGKSVQPLDVILKAI